MKNPDRPSGVQRLLSDIIELCELQWQLLSVDTVEAKQRTIRACIFLAAGLIVAVAGLVAGVLATGWLIHELAGMSVGLAFLLTSVLALVAATVAGLIGVKLISKASGSLTETKRELKENVKWLKAVILRPNSSARHQLRHASFPPHHVSDEESRFQNVH